MKEPYKQMYYQLYAKMADAHQTLETLLREIEVIMQKTEEIYMSSESEDELGDDADNQRLPLGSFSKGAVSEAD